MTVNRNGHRNFEPTVRRYEVAVLGTTFLGGHAVEQTHRVDADIGTGHGALVGVDPA